ncbi:protein of unknown function [Rhodovastum atsumiense]|nr:protein of unknown function [Rhodovastum atsumiense]
MAGLQRRSRRHVGRISAAQSAIALLHEVATFRRRIALRLSALHSMVRAPGKGTGAGEDGDGETAPR